MKTSVAIAALLALACSSAAAAPRPVVPWIDVHPVKASAHPPLAPPCRAGDLHAHLFLQGATGSLVGGVDLLNAGARACSLLGWPTVSFTGPPTGARWTVKRLAAPLAPPDELADPPGSLRALQPGKSATVSLWWSNWCDATSTPAGGPGKFPQALELGLASGTAVVVPVAGAPRCDAPQDPSLVSIGPFEPTERHLPASSRLPLRAAILGERQVEVKPGLRAIAVTRGERFHYEVAVTNTGARPFRFAATSCPEYEQQLEGGRPQVYVLNCRPVGTIAPHATVVFAMEISIPATARAGNNSLTWELAPRTYDPPFTPVALWVTAPLQLGWLQMTDASHGYALSGPDPYRFRLLSTSDGGRSWSDVTPADRPSTPLSIFGRTRLFSTTLRRTGVFAVERSDDGGRTWQRSVPFRDPHGAVGQPFAIDGRHLFLSVGEGVAAGSEAEALFTSSDGGMHWRFVSRTSTSPHPNGALPFGCDKSGFAFATPARGWAGGYCAGGAPFSYRTDDGGRTWRRQVLPVPQQCACETTAPSFFSPTAGALAVTGFAENGGGTPFASVLWTSDGGDHWRGTSPPTAARVVDVRFAGPADAWVVTRDELLRTADAGASWQTTRLPFDGSDYRLDPLGANVAFGFKVAAASSTIVVTRDGGRTWRTIHAVLRP